MCKLCITQMEFILNSCVYSCSYILPDLCVSFFLSNDNDSKLKFCTKYFALSCSIDVVSAHSYYHTVSDRCRNVYNIVDIIYRTYLPAFNFIRCWSMPANRCSFRAIMYPAANTHYRLYHIRGNSCLGIHTGIRENLWRYKQLFKLNHGKYDNMGDASYFGFEGDDEVCPFEQ